VLRLTTPHTAVAEKRLTRRGFTVLELLVVLAAIGLLLSVAAPRYMAHLDQGREVALRQNLQAMRQAIDQFTADRGVPPKSLQQLVTGRYLSHVPEDPMTGRTDTWRLVYVEALSSASAAMASASSPGIVDVRSGSVGSSRQGVSHASW